METIVKKHRMDPSTIEHAAGNEPLMVFSGVRSDEEVKMMSEWAAKRKAELALKSKIVEQGSNGSKH